MALVLRCFMTRGYIRSVVTASTAWRRVHLYHVTPKARVLALICRAIGSKLWFRWDDAHLHFTGYEIKLNMIQARRSEGAASWGTCCGVRRFNRSDGGSCYLEKSSIGSIPEFVLCGIALRRWSTARCEFATFSGLESVAPDAGLRARNVRRAPSMVSSNLPYRLPRMACSAAENLISEVDRRNVGYLTACWLPALPCCANPRCSRRTIRNRGCAA